MTTPDVSILYSARLDGSVVAGSPGDVLIPDATTGYFVKATTAARAGRRSTGVARNTYAAGGSVEIQQTGWLPSTISGLGAGAVSWVRVSAAGSLERCTPGAGDDLIGKAAADGSVMLAPGTWDSANYAGGGGGGGGTPGGANGDLQYNNAGAFGGITPGTGLTTWFTTPSSANLLAALTTKTGTGSAVFGTSPTIASPTIATIINTGTLTLPTSTDTLVGRATTDTLTNKTLTAPIIATIVNTGTLTLPTATDTLVGRQTADTLTNKTIAGASNTLSVRIANDVTGLAANVATFLGTPSGANLASALTSALPDTKGGTGLTALGANVATFLGTPSGANLASALTSALPDTKGGTGLTSLGTGVSTFLGTPSSANLLAALTTKTGTGSAVFGTSPTLSAPVIVGQIQGAAVAMGASAIDWSLGAVFTKTLSAGANTFTFSNQASGMTITVRVTGAASTLTWPTVKWAGGAAPTQTASGTDVYTFVHDGTNVYGSVVQAMS